MLLHPGPGPDPTKSNANPMTTKAKETETEKAQPPDPDSLLLQDQNQNPTCATTHSTPPSKALHLEPTDVDLHLHLDLVWVKRGRARARGRAHQSQSQSQWWPARVLSRSNVDANAQVSLFHGDGATSPFSCPASHLQPFFNPTTYSTHPAALHQALSFATRCLLSQFHHHGPNSNFTPVQFLSCLRHAAALSVQAVDLLDSLRLKTWVFALARARAHAHARPNPEEMRLHLHLHLDDDDDACPPDPLSPSLDDHNTANGSNGRTRSKTNKNKRPTDTDHFFQTQTPSPAAAAAAAAVAPDEAKRERKKSKYLSPPYTHILPMPANNQNLHHGHTQIGHTDDDDDDDDDHPPHNSNLSFHFDYQAVSVPYIFTDFLLTAMDPLYLKWKRSAKVLRFFFAKYRDTMFFQGREHASFTNHKCDCLITGKVKIETDLDANGFGSSIQSCLTPKTDRSDLTTGPDASTVGNKCENERGKEQSDIGALHPKKRGRPRKVDNCLRSSGSSIPIVQKSEQKMECKDFTSSVSSVSSNNIAEGAVLNFAKGPYDFLEEARAQTMKASPQQNSYKPAETNKQSLEQSSSKKLKTGNSNNSTEHDGGQKQKVAQAQFPNPAALLLDFSKPNAADSNGTNGTNLPSRDQLLSTFSKFGLLVDTQSDVDQDARSACVVFARSADAEAAYNSSDKLGLFGPPYASCRLRYLPPIGANLTPPSQQLPPLQLAAKPQLSDIRKNLEMMICSLTGGSAVHANGEPGSSLNSIKPEVRGSLVEKMQGLLMKVEKRLGGSSASSTATPSGVMPP